MTGKLAYLRDRLETSLWLVPSLLCLLSALAGLATLWIDRELLDGDSGALIGRMPADAARQLLGIIAGSVISVGGVTFSVTMVALTLTSGQYGPKIVRHFLEDVVAKVCLGLFLGTFIFALIALTGFADTDRPHLSVLVALLLAFAALIGFIQFIHRTATDLQADKIIERIGSQLQDALAQLCEPAALEGRCADTAAWRRAARSRRARTIASEKAGYIQAIDYTRLVDWCAARDCLLLLRASPGDFVLRRGGLFTVFGADDETIESDIGTLQHCFVTGSIRTPVQDPGFPITQLNQLVARALSPGINDPGTAITCIDWFSLSLSPVIDRDLPGCVFVDANAKPRVLARCPDFGQLMSAIHAPLREMGCGQVAVAARLFDSLAWLAELTLRPQRLRILELQGNRLRERLAATDLPPHDRQHLERRHRRLLALTRRRTEQVAAGARPA